MKILFLLSLKVSFHIVRNLSNWSTLVPCYTYKHSCCLCTEVRQNQSLVVHLNDVHVTLQVPYRLHAVLVHEGQANAGHYWAFIYDQPRKRWLKYNDIWVTESSWEELERESFGGLRNASAYCLMYISEQVSHVGAGTEPQLLVNEMFVCWCVSLACMIIMFLGFPAQLSFDKAQNFTPDRTEIICFLLDSFLNPW